MELYFFKGCVCFLFVCFFFFFALFLEKALVIFNEKPEKPTY